MKSILTKILLGLVLIILLASIGFNVYLAFRCHSLSNDVDKLTLANQTLTTNYNNCQSAVTKQNQDVINAQKDAQDKQKKLNDLQNTLNDQQSKNKDLTDKLAKQQAPKTCDAARDYLKNNLEQYAW